MIVLTRGRIFCAAQQQQRDSASVAPCPLFVILHRSREEALTAPKWLGFILTSRQLQTDRAELGNASSCHMRWLGKPLSFEVQHTFV